MVDVVDVVVVVVVVVVFIINVIISIFFTHPHPHATHTQKQFFPLYPPSLLSLLQLFIFSLDRMSCLSAAVEVEMSLFPFFSSPLLLIVQDHDT